MDLMLSVKDLDVYYGAIHAIKGISFEVNEGEIVTLIGANGAGKTTTLNMVTGLLVPDAGTAMILGQDVWQDVNAAKREIGACRSPTRYSTGSPECSC